MGSNSSWQYIFMSTDIKRQIFSGQKYKLNRHCKTHMFSFFSLKHFWWTVTLKICNYQRHVNMKYWRKLLLIKFPHSLTFPSTYILTDTTHRDISIHWGPGSLRSTNTIKDLFKKSCCSLHCFSVSQIILNLLPGFLVDVLF